MPGVACVAQHRGEIQSALKTYLHGAPWIKAMFTIAKIKNGETYLDHHLSANDYYTEKESVEGVWMGEGAKRLGIDGKSIAAGDALFEGFRNNIAPDGKPLTERGGENRIRFLDIQCGAPK